MDKLILLIPVLAILIAGTTTLAFSQGGPPGGGGPPKVDIFSKQVGNAILVTWENPDDTADDIVFRYTVSREVNRTDTFVPIFDSLRDIERKVIDETNGQEMFFYLDEDIIKGTDYAYQISAGNTQGNPNPVLSDDTRPIKLVKIIQRNQAVSQGHLIVTGSSFPPIQPIIWYDWFPIPLINAEVFSNTIFVTSVNPQVIESYRLLLEPIPAPENDDTCNQTLEFQYSKDQANGQDFQIVTTIIENEISRDDTAGEETLPTITIVEVPRHQKTWIDFTESLQVKQKWLVIKPENQAIFSFKNLEVQFDIIAEPTADPADFRSLSVWNVFFTVPSGLNTC